MCSSKGNRAGEDHAHVEGTGQQPSFPTEVEAEGHKVRAPVLLLLPLVLLLSARLFFQY